MNFAGNSVLFASVKNFANRSRIDEVIAMVRGGTLFSTHSVYMTTSPIPDCSF